MNLLYKVSFNTVKDGTQDAAAEISINITEKETISEHPANKPITATKPPVLIESPKINLISEDKKETVSEHQQTGQVQIKCDAVATMLKQLSQLSDANFGAITNTLRGYIPKLDGES